ncbi:MAG: hypothetical protein J6Z14_06600, partial [Prevotella sp.]|nr:hypothetical protein [Prevotella sp.]
MARVFKWGLLAMAVSALLAACSTTKYVPDGQLLLGQVKVVADDDAQYTNTSLLKSYVRQQPNAKWFSLFKLPLMTYSLSGRDSTKWINRTLRNMGEAPVIFDSLQARLTCQDLQQQLRNEGFLQAKVRMEATPHGRKRMDVTYHLTPGQPFFVHRLDYVYADSAIATMLA